MLTSAAPSFLFALLSFVAKMKREGAADVNIKRVTEIIIVTDQTNLFRPGCNSFGQAALNETGT